MDKRSRRFLESVLSLLLCMGAVLTCLHGIGDRRADQLYREARALAGVPGAAEPAAAQDAPAPETGAEAGAAGTRTDRDTGIDLSGLRAVNDDVVGWIEIPGILSYPLLQGEDNAVYLTHAWNGEENAAGAVFLDCRADAALGDFNTLVYGHRMRDGSMFGCLKHYKEASFWQEHPSVYLSNGDGIWKYDIYAAYEAELTACAYRQVFSGPEERRGFLLDGLERSVIDTGVSPTERDKVVTLSTCSAGSGRTRWVVQAVREEDAAAGEGDDGGTDTGGCHSRPDGKGAYGHEQARDL